MGKKPTVVSFPLGHLSVMRDPPLLGRRWERKGRKKNQPSPSRGRRKEKPTVCLLVVVLLLLEVLETSTRCFKPAFGFAALRWLRVVQLSLGSMYIRLSERNGPNELNAT